jgi:hypothetical protein
MFRFGFLFRFLLALVLIGVLVAGGMALYRTGWAQGYQTAAVTTAAGSAAGAAAPAVPAPYYAYPPVPYGYGYGFHPFFFPFGPLLGIGFFLFVIFAIGGLFRFGMRRHWAGGYGPGGIGFGHGPHSPQDWDAMRKEWEEFHKARAAKTQGSGEVTPESWSFIRENMEKMIHVLPILAGVFPRSAGGGRVECPDSPGSEGLLI